MSAAAATQSLAQDEVPLKGQRKDRSRSPRSLAKAECDAKVAHDADAFDADLLDGHSAEEIFKHPHNRSGYTYDDLICLPG
eukprot:CAMPEP_0115230218 /NCGR_PEP_ID=MMETSP0270-20121206/32603_1 /TAXON_ID=71861 /ORGANISM="Scrippsiella trochoidea, Strain CCMP3099" /LENGTH=80 /DNA_ID=CAMNT_0002644805 /DNA_START=48 /DNA_END=286 /DNA_ORIENTATION=-